ncbi:unnamed protein product [Symbiodinium necroappetens]|uniref:Uncharacterized protein n=1 Tax=Symbiodinium necroappetens TaxID=1628268 RepID=A0A813AZW0_9DINO|nr:unnamed protein product [Symbiodinium necroappetens]
MHHCQLKLDWSIIESLGGFDVLDAAGARSIGCNVRSPCTWCDRSEDILVIDDLGSRLSVANLHYMAHVLIVVGSDEIYRLIDDLSAILPDVAGLQVQRTQQLRRILVEPILMQRQLHGTWVLISLTATLVNLDAGQFASKMSWLADAATTISSAFDGNYLPAGTQIDNPGALFSQMSQLWQRVPVGINDVHTMPTIQHGFLANRTIFLALMAEDDPVMQRMFIGADASEIDFPANARTGCLTGFRDSILPSQGAMEKCAFKMVPGLLEPYRVATQELCKQECDHISWSLVTPQVIGRSWAAVRDVENVQIEVEEDDPSSAARNGVKSFAAFVAAALREAAGGAALVPPQFANMLRLQISFHDSGVILQTGVIQVPLDTNGFLVIETMPNIGRNLGDLVERALEGISTDEE